MKFQYKLYLQSVPEWRSLYINYGRLKEVLEILILVQNLEGARRQLVLSYISPLLESLKDKILKYAQLDLLTIVNFIEFKFEDIQFKFKQLPEDKKIQNQESGSFTLRFMTSLYLESHYLVNYIELNLQGFRKIAKKFKKSLVQKTDTPLFIQFYKDFQAKTVQLRKDQALVNYLKEGNSLINQLENKYVRASQHQRPIKESRQELRSLASNQQLNYKQTFYFGVYLGFSLIIILFIIFASLQVQYLSGTSYFNQVFPVMRGSALFILYYWMLCLDIFYWTSYKVNYVFIFKMGFKSSTFSSMLMRVSSLTFFWMMCTLLWVIHKTGFTVIGKISIDQKWVDRINILPWIVFLVYLLTPFDIFGRDGRLFILKLIGKTWACLFVPSEFGISWLTDQYISLLIPFKDLFYTICYYLNDKEYCTSTVSVFPNLILGLSFHFLRILQCIRNGIDKNHFFFSHFFFNSIKYLINMVTQTLAYFYSKDPTMIAPWIVMASISTIYSFYWDLKWDWDLLTFDSKKPLLRKDLVYKKELYYLVIMLNLVLRFMWVLSISPTLTLQIGIQPIFFTLIVSSMEILRRCLWNFLRVQKEHLVNCKKLNALTIDYQPESLNLKDGAQDSFIDNFERSKQTKQSLQEDIENVSYQIKKFIEQFK